MTTKQTTVQTTVQAAAQAAVQATARRRWWVRLAVLGPAAALVLQSGVVPAQQAPDQPLSPAVPAVRGGPPTTGPISSTNPSVIIPAQATRPAPTLISINFRDVSVDTVLEHLSDVAGFIIIKEAPVTGRVTVISKTPVTPEEAVALLNTVLKGNGYTAIRTGRTLKITTIENAKKGNIPVRFGADPEQIPETDDVVTQIIPVRSVDAVKLKADIQPLVGSGADLASNGGSNSIIITDNSANIKRVVTIIASLDKKDASESGIRIKQLKYADATSAAKLITDIFKTPDQQAQGNQGGFNPAAFFRGLRGGGGGGFPGGVGGGGGGGGGEAAADKGRIGTVLAEADTRTNTIVVTGPTDTLKVIDDVLTQLDANPAADQTFFIYKVKNGQAIDIQTTLNTLFGVNVNSSGSSSSRTSSSSLGSNRLGSGTGSSSSGGGGGSSFGSGSGSSFGSGSGSSGGFGSTSSNRSTSGGNTGGGNRSGGGGSGTTGLTGAAANLIGQVEVVADTDTNQLLVATATKYQQQVRDILKELDRPVPQVLIKVLVAEVTHDRGDDLGADFSVLNLRASGEGQRYGTSTFSDATSGGLAVAILERHVSAQIHALATADKLEVLSRPYILTSDNQEAYVLVGQEVPIITNTQVTEAGSTINSTRYQDIGVSLDVTPHINPDGLVTMDVSPQISSLSETSITVQSGVTNPIFNQRQAESHVAIRDGETIVIGGLMQDQKTQTVSKIPLLGDIPYLGLIFQRDVVTKTKTELLIFLTPHVALSPEVLQRMSADEMNGVQLTPNAVQPGTFPYHMQGLRRGGPATAPVLPVPTVPRDRDAWEPEPRLP